MNSGRRAEDQSGGLKDRLYGNGTLTVAARLSSVLAALVCTLVTTVGGFLFWEVWGELKATRAERQAVAVTLGRFDQRFAEIDRRNDVQDRYIDALRDRGRP